MPRIGEGMTLPIESTTQPRPIPVGRSLGERAPRLIAEWHPDNELSPFEVMSGSSKKARWLCLACGYDWFAVIFTRTKGVGCPRCADVARRASRKRPRAGHSFRDRAPDQAAMWDYSKNSTRPEDHNYGSADKFFFLCPAAGHSFEISLDHFGVSKRCPECRVTARSNWEMEVTRLLAEAGVPLAVPAPKIPIAGRKRPFTPDIVVPDWGVVVECDGWRWHKDRIDIDTAVTDALSGAGWTVIRARAGLPPITAHDVLHASTNPTADETATALLGQLVQMGFNPDPAAAVQHHSFVVPSRTGFYQKPAFKDSWAAAFPELVCEWDTNLNIRQPDEVTPGSGYPATWRCSFCDETWVVPASKRSPTLGCATCTYSSVDPSESIAALRPDMMLAWDPDNEMSPDTLRPMNNAHVLKWICPDCGHRFESTAMLRAIATHPCNECWGQRRRGTKKPKPGMSLGELEPVLAADWSPENDLTPMDVGPGSHFAAKWICRECGDTYESQVQVRVNFGGAHKKCSLTAASRRRHAPKPGQSLADLHPVALELWDWKANERSPHDLMPGSGVRASWTCNDGHKYERPVHRAVEYDFFCPDCRRAQRSAA